MKKAYAPRNHLGLALPPTPELLADINQQSRQRQPKGAVLTSRHHLYWPARIYDQDPLSAAFRRHRFNSVWLAHTDHGALHRIYRGTRMPSPDIMRGFLHEAVILDQLSVSVHAITMIDDALYEGRVKWVDQTYERRDEHETVASEIIHTRFEVVPRKLVRPLIRNALELIAA